MGEREVVESCGLDHFDGYGVLQMTYIPGFYEKSEAQRAHFVKITYLDLCANQRT